MLWNVTVNGALIWIQWTPNKARAQAEVMAWYNLAKITGEEYQARMVRKSI